MKTRKKAKIVGQMDLLNPETGELVPCQVINIEDRDANFHKIWLGHIIQSLDLIGNQKIRLANFILQNLDKENKLIMTQRKLAEKSGISYFTVAETMKALQESNFLTKINSGAYQINPEIIFKGGTNERMNVLLQYRRAKTEAAATKTTEEQTTIFDAMNEQAATIEPPKENLCPECGSELVERTNSYTGEKFMGCPNWKKHKKTAAI